MTLQNHQVKVQHQFIAKETLLLQGHIVHFHQCWRRVRLYMKSMEKSIILGCLLLHFTRLFFLLPEDKCKSSNFPNQIKGHSGRTYFVWHQKLSCPNLPQHENRPSTRMDWSILTPLKKRSNDAHQTHGPRPTPGSRYFGERNSPTLSLDFGPGPRRCSTWMSEEEVRINGW